MVKVADSYKYTYKKKHLIVSFVETYENAGNISRTSDMLRFLIERIPVRKIQDIYIEGLTDDLFYNFHVVGEQLFFSQRDSIYQNKVLIYGYLAYLYHQFSYGRQQMSPIPLESFDKLFNDQNLSRKNFDLLIDIAVDFALKEVFFVSVLELLERQGRYFYPRKTKEELYRVLIYPEVLSFWHYLESRFGKQSLFKVAEQCYSAEEFNRLFSESISDLESAYVKKIQANAGKNPLIRQKNLYDSYLKLLELYMSGTKRSLMRE